MNATAFLLALAAVSPQDAPLQEQEKHYVGEIIIVGNTHTPDRIVRAQVDLYPGQVLQYPLVRIAERNLNKLNWFHVDAKNGVRPTVQILDSKGPYKDILIKVKERPNSWVTLAAWDLVLARRTWNVTLLSEAADVMRVGVHEWRSSK
jgi:outer membrane protein insertion porin family